jgi:putative flippase GtrA
MKTRLWHTQLIRYGFVGIVSTTVHVLVASLLLKSVGLSLLVSNMAAFFSAAFVSYFGNATWSFQAKAEVRSMQKYVGSSVITLTLIVVISNGVTQAGLSPYVGILMIALIVPVVGFLLQKLWVFRR